MTRQKFLTSLLATTIVLAAGNANVRDEDPYFDSRHSLWQGRALAVVRNTGQRGKATLTVKAQGLPLSKITLK